MSEAGSSASLSVELRGSADAVWEAEHRHPFVRGVGDGTLEPERFNVWVRQDYLYLIEFARLHALGTARAPGLQAMTRFAEITQGLLHMEMDLHRSYAAEWGISSAELEREEMLPRGEVAWQGADRKRAPGALAACGAHALARTVGQLAGPAGQRR